MSDGWWQSSENPYRAMLGNVSQNGAMVMPSRFLDDEYTPRLWAELRNIKTDDLAKKMLA